MKIKKMIALLLMCVAAITVAVGCKSTNDNKKAKDASIVGTWKADLGTPEETENSGISLDLNILYTFKEDGTGSVEAMGMTVGFKYEVDGDKLTLSVTSDGETETESGTFKLEGNKLTLYTEGDEEDITVLERIK